MRRYVYVLCLVLVFFLQINGFAEQITILDMVGRKITIPREVKKVVPISASLRYIVYLDALDLVAGVGKFHRLQEGFDFIGGVAVENEVKDKVLEGFISFLPFRSKNSRTEIRFSISWDRDSKAT